MIQIERLSDDTLVWIVDVLKRAGYPLTASPTGIRLRDVGGLGGDHSVDVDVEVYLLDEVKVVRFHSPLRSRGGSFESAILAATRGNRATFVPRFEVEEHLGHGASVFHVSANFCLYADHLSEQELLSMMGLFLHEVDAIDNELVSIIEGNA